MGIFDALTTAVAGLQSQSFALQNISGNIANSQTSGYKGTNTYFEDLVAAAAANQQTANGVTAGSAATNTVQGTIQSTSVSTDMAINGQGWFVVAQPTGTADNAPVFSGVQDYTRAGDFQLNSGGYLVNGGGYYLMGIPIDAATGNPVGSSPQVLQFNNDFVPAEETTAIQYQANLPTSPSSGLMVPADYAVDPVTAGKIEANDSATFTSQSIDGGSITAYDTEGNPVNIQFRWAETAAGSWQLFYQSNSAATGTQTAWTNSGTTFAFNSSGQLSPAISNITFSGLTVNGDNLGNVQVNFGTNGLTQFANASGTAQVSQLQQNGFAAGQLQSVAVDSQNQITGTFSNGQTIPLAQITLATFNGTDSLQALNGEAYAQTVDSGPPIYGAPGKVVGSSLEASNVDIATQFSQLIVAQQAYSANARVMTTADQMIQSLLQVIQ
jgi:flagellar hook protein FlgE